MKTRLIFAGQITLIAICAGVLIVKITRAIDLVWRAL